VTLKDARENMTAVTRSARHGLAIMPAWKIAQSAEVRSVPLARRARELISAWLDVRGRHPGPIWTGQRGPLTISGITQVVLAGDDAGIPGLRPHRCRHTFATRLRQGGADPAQVQALLGHASIDTAARYFRAGSAENAEVVERVFGD
jgi:integrase